MKLVDDINEVVDKLIDSFPESAAGTGAFFHPAN